MWESNIAGCPIHSQLYREWVGNHKLPGNYPRTSRSAGCRVPHISILRCGKAISLGAPSIRSSIANGWETTNSQVIIPARQGVPGAPHLDSEMWESNIAGCPIHSQPYREWVGNHKLPGNYPARQGVPGTPHLDSEMWESDTPPPHRGLCTSFLAGFAGFSFSCGIPTHLVQY